jgi:hypothetical protein
MSEQQRIKSDDIISLDAVKINESAEKSLISTTEKSKLSSITAIFTTELKALYDGKISMYYPQNSLIVLPSLPSAATYNGYECVVGNLVYLSDGSVWTLLGTIDAGTFLFDQDSNLYQISQLEGVNNRIMFATKAAIEALLTGEITSHTHQPYPQTDLATASGTITLATNTVTNLTDTSTGTLTIAFGTAASNKANDYAFIIRIGGTLRTVNWAAGTVWGDNTAPTLKINKRYYIVSSRGNSGEYFTNFKEF